MDVSVPHHHNHPSHRALIAANRLLVEMKSEVERQPDLKNSLIRDQVLEKHLAQYDQDFKAEILREIPKNYKSTLGSHRRQFLNIARRRKTKIQLEALRQKGREPSHI